MRIKGELPQLAVAMSDMRLQEILNLVQSIPFPESAPAPPEEEMDWDVSAHKSVGNSNRFNIYWVNSSALGRCSSNFKSVIFNLIIQNNNTGNHCEKLLSGECKKNPSLMRSQYWFGLWFGVVRQQGITWASVDTVLCNHMTSLGHNELTHWSLAGLNSQKYADMSFKMTFLMENIWFSNVKIMKILQ